MTPTVLVVDDDPNIQRMMTKFLELEGFVPVTASNGQEALEYLRRGGNPHVILLDLRMPIMDGWTFRRIQRADPTLADIPVIVLTGIEGDLDDLSVAASFCKPVSLFEVASVVRRLCLEAAEGSR
jgi:CheY-like chemotaxis protein